MKHVTQMFKTKLNIYLETRKLYLINSSLGVSVFLHLLPLLDKSIYKQGWSLPVFAFQYKLHRTWNDCSHPSFSHWKMWLSAWVKNLWLQQNPYIHILWPKEWVYSLNWFHSTFQSSSLLHACLWFSSPYLEIWYLGWHASCLCIIHLWTYREWQSNCGAERTHVYACYTFCVTHKNMTIFLLPNYTNFSLVAINPVVLAKF